MSYLSNSIYITNTYPSLCVTCAILSKCGHTLFNSIQLHYFILMWFYPHKPFPNFILAYVKHKDSFHCILEDHLFLIIWPWHPNSQIHILQAKLHAISLSSQNHKKFKMLNQPFLIACLAWFLLLLVWWVYVVLFLYYSWCRVQSILLREVKELKLQKGKWHTFFYPFLLLH
jgi:hypothetical protein